MNDYTIRLLIPFASVISFFMVFFSIPTILRVAHQKNLFDEPGKRTVHKVRIPTLGGLAIFIGFLFTYSLFVDWFEFTKIPFLIPSILIIFGIGIKDDILVTAPILKLMGQIIASLIIVGMGDLRITDLHGFFGLQLNYLASVILTVFLMVFIINGFNLIDGIDGLAAITGIITIISFGIWFYINGNYHIPIMGAALVGGLLAFSYYNVFSKHQKIFMGDTGSLLLGFLLAVVAVHFSEFTIADNHPFHKYSMNSGPAVALAILVVPVIDTTRVFFLRISQGKSPFTADKNHIHHRMLALGFNHIQTSLILGAINIGFVILGYSLRNLGMLKLTLLIFILGLLIAYIPSLFLYWKRRDVVQRLNSINRYKQY
jgi:UDP-N-acetylmuramyl pentapeptide phosphotransferase/UDP-N-acetylglucosamine-1-phosphate transferase